MPSRHLSNVALPQSSPSSSLTSYDITVCNSAITSLTPHSPSPVDSPLFLLLPTLCHPHIHLDKAYLLTCSHSGPDLPEYTDLAPQSGTFEEALANTSKAKSRFTESELYLRGSQLLATSYTQGVTSARCFVEVDHVTQFKTLEVGLRLKREFAEKNLVDVQLCLFAQDPIFSTEHGEENRRLVEESLFKYAGQGIDVLGSTPYVEQSREASEENIGWAMSMALKYDLHLDFHLDYSLDTEPGDALVWIVLKNLTAKGWSRPKGATRNGRTVVLGHCTALTNFSASHLRSLSAQIKENDLPVYFVGLPTSDIYMMGRPPESQSSSSPPSSSSANNTTKQPMHRPRGTLNPITLHKHYGIKTVLGVNNVGNAFTPFGTGDPLSLASFGVGLYHAGTGEDAEILFDAVSRGARRAIGIEDEELAEKFDAEREGDGSSGIGDGLEIREGMEIPQHGFLLIRNEEWVGCPGHLGMKVPARQRRRARDVVWDVPEVGLRKVIR